MVVKTKFKSVDEYISTQPQDVQAALTRVRATIRKALPGADEVISYQIPTYKINGQRVIFFAGWKEHYSIYPVGGVEKTLKKELAPYGIEKGTIRFPLSKPVPVKLIERIATLRAKEAAAGAKAKKR